MTSSMQFADRFPLRLQHAHRYSHLLFAALLATIPCDTASGQDMPLSQVLLPGAKWELLGEGYQFTEGPAVSPAGEVFFTDVPASKIYRITPAGKVSLFAENTARTNGLMFGPDGRLYGCRNRDRAIVARKLDGTMETIATDVASNDIVVLSDGSLYFTDPSGGTVWRVAAGGKPTVVAQDLRPNGLILWPDEGTLVVTDSAQPWLWTYRIGTDGTLQHGDRYYGPLRLPSGNRSSRPGSDGMTVDRDGRLYVATRAGIQMFDTTGRMGGVIPAPQPKFLSNVVFGGPKFEYLYATCTDRVYRLRTKTAGAPYFLRARQNTASGQQ